MSKIRDVFYLGSRIATCDSMAKVAWEIVNHYVMTHPGITLAGLRSVFSTIPSNPAPLICEWHDAVYHYKKDGSLDIDRYLNTDPYQIKLYDELIVTVSNQWKDNDGGNFRQLRVVAASLGYSIK